MIDWLKLTCPIPSANIIRDAYGNVSTGKIKLETVFMRLNI